MGTETTMEARPSESVIKGMKPVVARETSNETGVSSCSDFTGYNLDLRDKSDAWDFCFSYLHKLGAPEQLKLDEMVQILPVILQNAREMSTAVRERESLTFWNVDLERPSDARDILLLKHIRAEEGGVLRSNVKDLSDVQ